VRENAVVVCHTAVVIPERASDEGGMQAQPLSLSVSARLSKLSSCDIRSADPKAERVAPNVDLRKAVFCNACKRFIP
jgi:hypothetical protein